MVRVIFGRDPYLTCVAVTTVLKYLNLTTHLHSKGSGTNTSVYRSPNSMTLALINRSGWHVLII